MNKIRWDKSTRRDPVSLEKKNYRVRRLEISLKRMLQNLLNMPHIIINIIVVVVVVVVVFVFDVI